MPDAPWKEVMAFGAAGQCRDRAVMQELDEVGANRVTMRYYEAL